MQPGSANRFGYSVLISALITGSVFWLGRKKERRKRRRRRANLLAPIE